MKMDINLLLNFRVVEELSAAIKKAKDELAASSSPLETPAAKIACIDPTRCELLQDCMTAGHCPHPDLDKAKKWIATPAPADTGAAGNNITVNQVCKYCGKPITKSGHHWADESGELLCPSRDHYHQPSESTKELTAQQLAEAYAVEMAENLKRNADQKAANYFGECRDVAAIGAENCEAERLLNPPSLSNEHSPEPLASTGDTPQPQEDCSRCSGSGRSLVGGDHNMNGAYWITCPKCNGTGKTLPAREAKEK